MGLKKSGKKKRGIIVQRRLELDQQPHPAKIKGRKRVRKKKRKEKSDRYKKCRK